MTHYSEVLAWVLLHFIWEATAIAVIYKLLDRRIAPGRPGTRYNLALTALLCMFGSSVLTLFYEHLRISSVSSGRSIIASALLNSSVQNATHIAPMLMMIHEKANGIMQLIDMVWLAGVLMLFVRALGGAWMISRLRTALSYAPGEELAQRFRYIAQRLDLHQRITLRIHSAAICPFVAGTFRSVVYLPASALTSLSPDQIDAIIAHELAHVRRADYFWNLLQAAMETLFFFHPAVWWIGRVLREQRELCCDDIALQCSSNPISYAKALLVLAEGQYGRPRFAMLLGGQRGRKHLLSRISRILGETCIPKDTTPAVILRLAISGALAAIVLCCSIAMTPVTPVQALQAIFQKQPESAPSSRPINPKRVLQKTQSRTVTASSGRDSNDTLLPQGKQLRQEGQGVQDAQTNQASRPPQLPQELQMARLGSSRVGTGDLSSMPNPDPHPTGESPHPQPKPSSPQPHPSKQL